MPDWYKGQGFEDYSITRQTDGYRVTGRGKFIACDSLREAEEVVAELYAASSTAASSPPREKAF